MTPIEAGRELDALVAEQVMGWRRLKTACNDQQKVTVPPDWTDLSIKRWLGHDINELVPPYSSEIAAAWRVWEKLPDPKRLTEGESGATIYSLDDDDAIFARVYVLCGGASYGAQTDISYKFVGWGATPSEAICRAALAALSQPSTESAADAPASQD